jgi:hypothetical protein
MEQRRGGDFVDRQPGIVQVSCVWCERLHPAEHALEFNPVCPTCTGR